MDTSTWWWLLTGALVVVELLSGSLYLLMLAAGSAAGAISAHLGLSLSTQITVASVVGGFLGGFWHWRLRRRQQSSGGRALGTHADPDLALDLGQRVSVTQWEADGSTQVQYRGAMWRARLAQPSDSAQPPPPGVYRIHAMQGNILLIVPDLT